MVLAAVMLFAVACGGNDDGGETAGNAGTDKGAKPAGEKVDVVKLAAPAELTGPVAGFGVPYMNAMKIAIEEINNAGGIKSLGGAKLELMLQDSESNPQKATQLLRQMDKEATMAVGPLGSANVVAVKPVLVSLDMPIIVPSLEDTITDGEHGHNMWRVVSRTADWGNKTMDFIEEAQKSGKIDVKKVGIVSISTPPGPSLVKVLEERSKALGWEIKKFEYNPAETRDFSSLIAQIRDANPDLVVGLNYPQDGILFAQAVTLQDWRPKFGFVMTAGAYYLNAFRKALGEKTIGWMDASYGAVSESCEMSAKLSKIYEERHKSGKLTGLDTAAPAAIAVIADALERAGSTDRDKLRAALAETKLEFCESTYTLAGNVQFNEKGDNAGYSPTMIQHVGKTDMPGIWPSSVASGEATWPAHDKAAK
jgi:branched-chain amino acid transport system substrate-binding protein